MPESRIFIARDVDHLPWSGQVEQSLILPSSADRSDDAVTRLRRDHPGPVRLPHWRGPFAGQGVRLDRRVAMAPHLTAVVNLDLVGERGPFVLDLLARYLSPVERAKILAVPGQIEAIARINLARRFDRIVIAKTGSTGAVWIETNDAIAGELVCLTLSEDRLPGGRSVTSPWEDELVQRSTELGIGARYPGDIHAEMSPGYVRDEQDPVIVALHLRIGIDI